MEWFYFILYGAIVLASLDALAFAYRGDRGLRGKDNLLAKLAFWPVLMGCFYAVARMFVI